MVVVISILAALLSSPLFAQTPPPERGFGPCEAMVLGTSPDSNWVRDIARVGRKLEQISPALSAQFTATMDGGNNFSAIFSSLTLLRERQLRHSFDHFVAEAGREELSPEETAFLRRRHSSGPFSLENESSQAIAVFFGNSLGEAIRDLERSFRFHVARTAFFAAGIESPERELVSSFARIISRWNRASREFNDPYLSRERFQEIVANYRVPNPELARAFSEAFAVFKAGNWDGAQAILRDAGVLVYQLEEFRQAWNPPRQGVGATRSDATYCCQSTPGCPNCPFNRSFLR